ncbi:hypothetical protein [Nocardioides mangrovi]|uniref:Uncharacterized protein n=1 Tax=Nocardioides mangrovi TaxID=2874580 RepID=A0ABS7UG22_9ACTN|nr:hypothetical protein [Nocardioides mangrovi]MBZ5739745.1 hypothetical protein [Nocardioides mangrovi]
MIGGTGLSRARTRARRAVGVPTLAGLSVAVLLLAGCDLSDDEDTHAASTPVTASPSARPHTGRTVLLEDDHGRPAQAGTAAVEVRVAALDGGSVAASAGPDGARAIAFPPYRATGTYPRAVVVVTNKGDDDELNPGTAAFTWGTDFKIDARSEGRTEDNGDNLVQRGIYSEPTLYKAELDLGRPACVVQGVDGIVTIRSSTAVIPGIWYHMECRRDGAEVTVTSWPLDDPNDRTTRIGVGPTGDVTPVEPSIPLSVGGKVSQTGEVIKSATDQLNGDLARPFLEIDGA